MITKATEYDKAVLNAARMATLRYSAETEQAQDFVHELFERTIEYQLANSQRDRRPQAQRIPAIKSALGAFAADLLHHSLDKDSCGFCFRSNDPVAIKNTLCSHDNFQTILKTWPFMDLVERVVGSNVPAEDMEGNRLRGQSEVSYASRFRALPALLDLASNHGITPETIKTHFSEDIGVVAPCRLRGSNKKLHGVDKKRARAAERSLLKHPTYLDMCDRVERLNEALLEHTYSLEVPPRIQRIYSNADSKDYQFNEGGRFFAKSSDNWQLKKSHERLQMRIDGKRVAEVDVRASHLFILHAMNGADFDVTVDPYALDVAPRAAVKQALVMLFGSHRMPAKWPKGVKQDLEQKHNVKIDPSLKTILEAVMKKYPLLRKFKDVPLWQTLQYEESECFLEAMETMLFACGCACLPVHDSLVVCEEEAELASRVIKEAYEKRYGQAPKVRIDKPSKLDLVSTDEGVLA